jgi:AsmA protein
MKRLLTVLGLLIVLVIVVLIAIPFFIDANQFRPSLETELTQALSRQVKLGDLKLAIWSGSVSASDISIADDPAFGKNPFLSAKSLGIVVELQPLLFSRKLNVTGIQIDSPQIALIQSRTGAWNFSSLGSQSVSKTESVTSVQTPDLSVKLVKITNGRISLLQSGDTKPKVFDKVGLEFRDFTPTAAFPFSLTATIQGGGNLKLSGKAGPISANNAAETPFEATLKLEKLDVVHAGFVRETTGFGGLLSIDDSIASNGKTIDIKGAISADQLKLARNGTPAKKTVAFDFALKHDTIRRTGDLSRGDVRIGKAKAALTGTYAVGEQTTNLKLKLSAPAMEIDELEAMLPSLAIVLPRGSSLKGGTALANVTVEGPADNPVIAGSVSLKNTRLTGFDLGSQIKTVASLAGIKVGPDTDFENVGADITMNGGAASVQNISVVAPAIGNLTGAGTVSTSDALDFKMKAAVKSASALNAITSNVPFFIRGTSSEPKFVPDVKGMAAGAATNMIKDVTGGDATSTGILNLFKKKKADTPAGR